MANTRSALRSQGSHENPTTSPSTNASKRAPLGEITGNQEEAPVAVDDPEEILKANKGTAKEKKSKRSKKSKKDAQSTNNEPSGKVLPDENESETSSAVDNACQDLLKDQTQDTSRVTVHEDRPSTPPSPAVAAANLQLSPALASHNLAKPVPKDDEAKDQVTDEHQATTISTEPQSGPTSKSKHMPLEAQLEKDEVTNQQSDASGQAKMQSPKRLATRPEDSIEAIDKFEEEIEIVSELIPAVKKQGQSPKEKGKRDDKGLATNEVRDGPPSKRSKSVVNPTVAPQTKKGSPGVVTANSKTKDTKTDPKTRTVSNSSSTAENSTSVAAKKRVSSVHKAPFVPTKSTKPPTRASFELPGEAVARKLKEAREERMKREEEEKDIPKKTTFKARPVRLSQAPVVKATATSRARISMAKGETPVAVSTTKNATPTTSSSSRPAGVANRNAGKRLSTLSVNKRLAPTPANTSARLSRGNATNLPNDREITKSRLSIQPSVRQSISASDAAQMKAKGKSIFNRGRIEHDELEQMKKAKEEAARKARAEAAERGRIASREWAEKQKAKKVAAKKGSAEATVGGEA